jgi:hypothetical protein
MIPTRESTAEAPNERLRRLDAEPAEGNVAWFARASMTDGIVLLGGTSLADFRVRVAQSGLRSDLTPSYWSICGVLVDGHGRFLTAPLRAADPSESVRANAVESLSVTEFDDPVRWPNIAILRFIRNADVAVARARYVADRRTVIDLPGLLLAWLAYVWDAGDGTVPLRTGHGVPSAAFVETAYALADIELTPGLSSAASCPEAIWQAVKWWHEYYLGTEQVGAAMEAGPMVPEGIYCLRQRSAAIELPPDAPLFLPGIGGGPAPTR